MKHKISLDKARQELSKLDEALLLSLKEHKHFEKNLMRRISFGKIIAELKYKEFPQEYNELVKLGNVKGIINKIRNIKVEREVLKKVREQGKNLGLNVRIVSEFYEDYVIPMTIGKELNYLVKRAKRR